MLDESGSLSFLERLERIQERVSEVVCRIGRNHKEITLVAVTKRQPISVIETAHRSGLMQFGENYVQEAMVKRATLSLEHCRWHLLGHLQSNKVKVAVQTFDLIQSVDSVRLADQIGKQAEAQGKIQPILLQVHLGNEETKSGFSSEDVLDATHQVLELSGVMLNGLMGIAPGHEDPRPHFRTLRRLFEGLPAASRTVLSMGMTGDFETAIEEGTTMIRIGTALFGPRTASEVTETPA